jgi:hypothetical protein
MRSYAHERGNVVVIKTIVTERGPLNHDVTAETPTALPNARLIVMNAALVIAVRAGRTFIQAFLAALGLGALGPSLTGVSDVLPPGSAGEKLLAAVYIGLLAALISALQNAVELLGKIDSTHPTWRA